MKLPRRSFLHLAAGAAAVPAVSRFALAQAYPSRPVHILVGFAPGGPTDIAARLIGKWLSDQLGQQFIVENRPGAASLAAIALWLLTPNQLCRNQHVSFCARRGTCVAVGRCARGDVGYEWGHIGSIGGPRDSVRNRRDVFDVRP
jgi:hypothetical protein